MEGARCSATSKQSGIRCKRWPVPGARVCFVHGGGAPAVVARARLRLAENADVGAVRLVDLIGSDDPGVAHRAACAVLDRAGIGRSDRVEVTGAISVQAEQIVTVITNVIGDLGIDLDDRVRRVVASNLRAMSASTRALSVVPDA